MLYLELMILAEQFFYKDLILHTNQFSVSVNLIFNANLYNSVLRTLKMAPKMSWPNPWNLYIWRDTTLVIVILYGTVDLYSGEPSQITWVRLSAYFLQLVTEREVKEIWSIRRLWNESSCCQLWGSKRTCKKLTFSPGRNKSVSPAHTDGGRRRKGREVGDN